MKKLFAVLLALTLVLSMGTIALAAGDGSITVENAVDGEIYTIYKMFNYEPVDGDMTKGRYTYASDAWEAFVETGDGAAYLELDAETDTIVWKGDVDENGDPDPAAVAELAKKAVAYAKDAKNGIAATASTTADEGKAEFTNLDLGYYAVDTSLGTICSLTTTNTAVEVTDKNTGGSIEKKIVETTGLVDANNAAINEKVYYQATVTAGKGTVNYVVHDTMSAGLTFDSTSVVVKKGDTTLKATDDYVLRVPGTACEDDCTFEIDFTDAFEATLAEGDKVVITYNATLNENAVIGAEGNPNEIYLEYGNAQKTTEDYVITYTTRFTVDKVDGNGDPLEGAGFTLYKGTGDTKVPVGTEISGTDLTTFVWNGLEEGTYTLVETTVPEGYNKAKDIVFTITCDEPTKVNAATDKADWNETVSADVTESIDENDAALDVFEATVVNRTGALLPETGGIGTTIFYIVGIVMMLGAGIILISKKRMASFA